MASLSSIRIPSTAVPVLKRVVELEQDTFDLLVGSLSTGSVRDMPSLKAAIRSAVGTVWQDDDDVDALVSHLMSMSSLGTSHAFTPGTLAVVVTEKVGTQLGEPGAAILPERLAALLSARDFQAFSKAVDIATEDDQVLHFSRIVSDVRPVFDQDANDDPLGAVIVHTLRIDYFNEGRVKTTSFSLNEHDLKQLKTVVDRALSKQQTLSRLLERLPLTEFDMTSDDDE